MVRERHPTDARLYEKARRRLVTLAQEADLSLRESYARLAPRLAGQVGRYAHARQFKRMRKALRRLKGYIGRVMRDIQRHQGGIADAALRQRIEAEIALVNRLLRQRPKDNIRMILAHIRTICAETLATLMAALNTSGTAKGSKYGLRALAT